MAFILHFDRPWGQEIARLLEKQLRTALEHLSAVGEAIHDGIHDARRCFRRARALLLLASPTAEHRAPIEQPLRDAGRALSPLRDAHAILEALDAWTSGPDRAPPEALARALRRALVRRRARAFTGAASKLRAAREHIAAAQGALDGFRPETVDAHAGLCAGFARARTALRRYDAQPADEALHRFRRRLRTHLLHMELAREAWPVVLAATEGELRRVSHGLGGARDLEMLAAASSRLRDADPAFVAASRTRAATLQGEALDRARLAFAEPRRAFAARWRAWLDRAATA